MKRFVILSIITGLLILGGCSKKQEGGPIEITYWHTWTVKKAQQAMNNIIDQFNKQNPGIKVVPLIVMFSETGPYIQKVLTAIAGGKPPDILSFSGIPVLAGKNALLSLDDFMKRSNFDIENFLSYRVKVASLNGKQYGIPFTTSANSLLFYNKEHFREVGLDPDKPPRTWKELEDAARKLTIIKNGRIERLGFVPNWGQGNIYAWIWANGGEVIADDNKTILVDKPEAIEALEWIIKFTEEICGGSDAVASFNLQFQGLEQGPFYIGKVSMVITGSWDFGGMRIFAPDMDFGVALLPCPENGKHITSCGGFSFCIPKGAKHPEEAWKFIKYITSEEIQLQWAKETTELPTRPACWEDEFFQNDPKWRVVFEAMKNAHPFPELPFSAEMWQYISMDALQLALFHKKTPKEALVEAANKLRKVIEEYYTPKEK